MKIPRSTFISAIEAGIEAADLDPQQEERLLNVALTAKTADTNYSDRGAGGCPATQAGLDSTCPVFLFACAYDRALLHAGFSVFSAQSLEIV